MTPRPGELAWTEDDVEYALEWQAMQDAVCAGCGQPRDESFSPEFADAYVASLRRCHACAESQRAQKDARDGGMEPEGLYTSVQRETPHTH